MQVVIHAGAHFTDDERLTNCLLANRAEFADAGLTIPGPQSYRKVLRDLMSAAKEGQLGPNARETVLNKIGNGTEMGRLFLSNAGLFGTPKMAIAAGSLYTAAEERLSALHQIFDGDQISLCMAVCNPATFLPAIFNSTRVNSFDEFMNGADPRIVRWSEMIARLRAAYPQMPITVWCNEDLPMIWAEVIREMVGLPPEVHFSGEFALLEEIMTPAGLKRFHSYLGSHPGMSESQKRRVIAAFLDKFALEEAIEEELDIFGWDADLIDELTDIYDADLFAIEAIENINLIAP